MVDEEYQEVASEPVGGAPVNRDKRHTTLEVIEGEAASRGEGEPGPLAAEAEEHAPPDEATGEPVPSAGEAGDAAPSTWEGQAGRPRWRGLRAFVSGAFGGLIVSALVGGAGYYLLAPKANLAEEDAGRLAAIESQAQREDLRSLISTSGSPGSTSAWAPSRGASPWPDSPHSTNAWAHCSRQTQTRGPKSPRRRRRFRT